MMLTNPTIHATRAMLVWAIRAAALVLVSLGLFLIAARLMYGFFGVGDLPSAWKAWQGVGEDHGFFRGVPMTLIGVALAVLSKRLARWIITPPDSGCPRCAYPSTTDRPDTCTECGYQPPSQPPNQSPSSPEPAGRPTTPASAPQSPTPAATP